MSIGLKTVVCVECGSFEVEALHGATVRCPSCGKRLRLTMFNHLPRSPRSCTPTANDWESDADRFVEWGTTSARSHLVTPAKPSTVGLVWEWIELKLGFSGLLFFVTIVVLIGAYIWGLYRITPYSIEDVRAEIVNQFDEHNRQLPYTIPDRYLTAYVVGEEANVIAGPTGHERLRPGSTVNFVGSRRPVSAAAFLVSDHRGNNVWVLLETDALRFQVVEMTGELGPTEKGMSW